MSLSASEFYEAWTNELSSRVEGIVSGKVTTVPGEQVFADIAADGPCRTHDPRL